MENIGNHIGKHCPNLRTKSAYRSQNTKVYIANRPNFGELNIEDPHVDAPAFLLAAQAAG
ncbi:MAG TPA: hypothetical protein VJS38_17135 [Phenylobacterium sp.]|uniref:hypothetical protein n=1 Tax=Phenylobacterium sp. TaxID=1871053 RepID=UPI002B498F0A|nr:hypothetical protein [Phenylobacterium sp.]HKR89896.1 hypothetical protein [Phenylobacterium sp.]